MALADYFSDEKTAPWAWAATFGVGWLVWKTIPEMRKEREGELGNPDYGDCGCGCKAKPGGCGGKKPEDYCPPATKNIGLNTKNRQVAINRFDYGPLNPNMPSLSFWKHLAKRWNHGKTPTSTEVKEAMGTRCGNCSLFDLSPLMRKCLPPIRTADDYDREAEGHGVVLGYCWAHKFKCASNRTCATWVAGGPIRTNTRSPLAAKLKEKIHGSP
jgi:hypothetical protein